MDNQLVECEVYEKHENSFGLTNLQLIKNFVRKHKLSALFFGGYTHTEHLGEGSRKIRTMANKLTHYPDLPSLKVSALHFLGQDFERDILPKIKREIGYDFMALAVPSLFISENGEKIYFPMIDFESPRTNSKSQQFIKDLLFAMNLEGFILASSEQGLHFIGENITTEENWKKDILKLLLTHDCKDEVGIDCRWLIHRLIDDGQTRLRVWYDVEKIGPQKKGWREPVVIARMKNGIFHTRPEFWLPGGLSLLPEK